jgi:sulfhydrogenase subunit beta (sulfur reductase)
VTLQTTTEREEIPSSGVLCEKSVIFAAGELQKLIAILLERRYAVIGPTPREGAIVYDAVQSAQDLPLGWTDEQAPGRYRLKRHEGATFFGYSIGAQSWKRYLHPAEIRLWSAQREGTSFRILNNEETKAPPLAFLGVRACELSAIAIQDRVFLQDRYRDPIYESRRSRIFVVAVQCTRAAATCFCASMQTGPAVSAGADLILTELLDARGHRFLARAGSQNGEDVLAELKTIPATEAEVEEAESRVQHAASQQSRSIDKNGIRATLNQNFEHSRWAQVASRCLTCANCTMVCPTCFCTTVEDASDVTGDHAERWRRWDSCFSQNFSYIHGGSVRASAKARYRQWMTHKLAAWIDQFGSSGCVGCGRCITWCPAGIDITEEARALQQGADHGNS